ncbi:type II toxin-antitoxin system RelB/DinJ family antitoxin [Sporolactobacillus shoreicorticis]|uniref:Type II toxin-antitoxin system RelB/DinJ family antitoxin n=1 Tax=Sporolactobacillus shoreicorticis TaxID=1923877 RepID=A0ABW5S235_9BACL|nr:type II toxin-antitoxin system RelB/DinJ family antitoxin [Sporolactobacillus shoreicorticis]MCO7126515.1 type II toxin-antitoxin system RelB/DinJ family antitoxin [Sporolactobacillus shoreicorticis]
MAQTKNVQVRLDEKLKDEANKVFDEMGLSMTSAITLFIKQVVTQRRIPFEIVADPFYSEENQSVLRESLKQYQMGKLKSHKLIDEEDE